ncbi:hypothetical protein [Frateuria soli]|uniref:hypothetical protein n=1 Tax=Frateuria soli TaxID=1542730 RepID=UPI001E649E7A|nr:hypothetical protein [Frateuria soli]UGB39718.1 hypothetical protein LQ771_07785 [Frateuria soli]
MQSAKLAVAEPAFLPLVEACRQHGIGRTKAFELAAAGTLETFTIGSRRYVRLDSLRALPERLKAEGGAQ